MTERTGQQFLVENLSGANGSVGTANVAQAAPDGYRLVPARSGNVANAPAA